MRSILARTLVTAALIFGFVEGKPSNSQIPEQVRQILIQQLCSQKDLADCENRAGECMELMESSAGQRGDISAMCPGISATECLTKVMECSEILKPAGSESGSEGGGSESYESGEEEPEEMGSEEFGSNMSPQQQAQVMCSMSEIPNCEQEVTNCMDLSMMLFAMSGQQGGQMAQLNPSMCEVTSVDGCKPKVAKCNSIMQSVMMTMPPPDTMGPQGPGPQGMAANMSPQQHAQFLCSMSDTPNCLPEVMKCLETAMMLVTMSGGIQNQGQEQQMMIMNKPDPKMCAATDIPDCEVTIRKCNSFMETLTKNMAMPITEMKKGNDRKEETDRENEEEEETSERKGAMLERSGDDSSLEETSDEEDQESRQVGELNSKRKCGRRKRQTDESEGRRPNGDRENGRRPNGGRKNGRRPNGGRKNGRRPKGGRKNCRGPNGGGGRKCRRPNRERDGDQKSGEESEEVSEESKSSEENDSSDEIISDGDTDSDEDISDEEEQDDDDDEEEESKTKRKKREILAMFTEIKRQHDAIMEKRTGQGVMVVGLDDILNEFQGMMADIEEMLGYFGEIMREIDTIMEIQMQGDNSAGRQRPGLLSRVEKGEYLAKYVCNPENASECQRIVEFCAGWLAPSPNLIPKTDMSGQCSDIVPLLSPVADNCTDLDSSECQSQAVSCMNLMIATGGSSGDLGPLTQHVEQCETMMHRILATTSCGLEANQTDCEDLVTNCMEIIRYEIQDLQTYYSPDISLCEPVMRPVIALYTCSEEDDTNCFPKLHKCMKDMAPDPTTVKNTDPKEMMECLALTRPNVNVICGPEFVPACEMAYLTCDSLTQPSADFIKALQNCMSGVTDENSIKDCLKPALGQQVKPFGNEAIQSSVMQYFNDWWSPSTGILGIYKNMMNACFMVTSV